MKTLDPIRVPLLGTHLIEASAGTGKTYAIATLYVRCLLERDIGVEKLLVVTYTRAATAELRERIRTRIRETIVAFAAGASEDLALQSLLELRSAEGELETDCKRLTLALRSFDQAGISTIHGFCQRCLQDSAFESGADFDSSFETDDRSLIAEITNDFWAREMFSVDPAFFAFLSAARFDLNQVQQLCSKVVGDEDLPVLPSPEQERAAPSELGPFGECYRRLRRCWLEERASIIKLLIDSDQLHQGSYAPKHIKGSFVPAIDRLFASEQAMPVPEEHRLLRLSGEVLQSKTKKGKMAPSHSFFELASEFARLCPPVERYFQERLMALKLRLVEYARSESRSRKLERASLSFDDLLLQLRTALRSSRGLGLAKAIRARFPIALIDEFQDTDPIQYEVFNRIYQQPDADELSPALFLIGDPKQAIYGFRGADLFTYFAAREDAHGRAHTLDTNYRSSPGMVDAVNTLFGAGPRSFLFEQLPFAKVAHAPSASAQLVDPDRQSRAFELLHLRRTDDSGRDITKFSKSKGHALPWARDQAETACTNRVAGEIVSLLLSDATIEGRPIRPGDIAVLVRQNKQARAMQDALRLLGVPSVLESNSSVFSSNEAEEVERILAAMVQPGDRNAIKAALATSLLGYSGNALYALQEDEQGWDHVLLSFRRWQAIWLSRGFIQAFSQMLHDQNVARRLLERPGGQRKMTNVNQLGELLQKRALESNDGPQVLFAWLSTMRVDREARAAIGEAAQLRLETDAAAVNLVTVHKSKGLEYPIVFCPYVWDGQLQFKSEANWIRFHDESDDNRLKLDIGSEDSAEHLAQSAREALAEDLRLLYVALTRARHRCAIVCGAIKSFGSSGLAYLLLRPEDQATDSQALAAFASEVEELEDSQLATRLQALCDQSEHIALRSLESYGGPEFVPPLAEAKELQYRETTRTIARHWRNSSFSGLTKNSDSDHDHDAHSDDASEHQSSEPVASNPILLQDFPRGAHPGQMLHHVFEHLDFWKAEPDRIESQIVESLEIFGFDVGRWTEPLAAAYQKILCTPLSPEGFCLADVPASQRLDELEFSFPVRSGGGSFNSAILANALRERAQAPWSPGYLQAVESLGFAPLSGFLKGFMDLVFVHNERYYLVDYKSNYLGPYAEDYRQGALIESMAQHHYFLQYHIYLVALDRYLRLRIPDYDYDRHMGGVFYLYLRGMAPEFSPDSGVFADKPSAAEMAVLDRAFRSSGETR